MSAVPVTTPVHGLQRSVGYRLMFLGIFGTCWTIIGCVGYYGASIPVLTIVTLIGTSIFSIGWALRLIQSRTNSAQETELDRRRGKSFRNINVVQWISIFLLLFVLNLVHHPEWIFSGVLLVVGLHFLPLARLFASRLNLITGLVLIAVALASPTFGAGGPASPAVPLLAGITLWASALATLGGLIRRGQV